MHYLHCHICQCLISLLFVVIFSTFSSKVSLDNDPSLENIRTEVTRVFVVEPGVRFPDDSANDVQKQKQLLKDAAAFLVSCQIPSLVSNTDAPTDPGHIRVEFSGCVSEFKAIYVCVCVCAL